MATLRRLVGYRRQARGQPRAEHGQSLALVAIMLPLAVILVGLVVDGGLMYLTYRRATIAANLGAQAASHAVDEAYYRETNLVRLDEGRALGIARQYAALNAGRLPIQVTGLRLERRTLWVAARTRYDTLFMRLVGIPTVTLAVEGRAYAAFGIHREGQ
jgi:hypothetical protein